MTISRLTFVLIFPTIKVIFLDQTINSYDDITGTSLVLSIAYLASSQPS